MNFCRNQNQKPWSFRRHIVVCTLIFNAVIVLICLFHTSTHESIATTAITSAFSLAAAVIGSYIFGAVWQDRYLIDQFGKDPGRKSNE